MGDKNSDKHLSVMFLIALLIHEYSKTHKTLHTLVDKAHYTVEKSILALCHNMKLSKL